MTATALCLFPPTSAQAATTATFGEFAANPGNDFPSQPSSDGVTFGEPTLVSQQGWNLTVRFPVIIDSKADGSKLHVLLSDAEDGFLSQFQWLPGVTWNIVLDIQNDSGHDYSYVPGSLQAGTGEYFCELDAPGDYSVLATGFDGFPIYENASNSTHRIYDEVLASLGLYRNYTRLPNMSATEHDMSDGYILERLRAKYSETPSLAAAYSSKYGTDGLEDSFGQLTIEGDLDDYYEWYYENVFSGTLDEFYAALRLGTQNSVRITDQVAYGRPVGEVTTYRETNATLARIAYYDYYNTWLTLDGSPLASYNPGAGAAWEALDAKLASGLSASSGSSSSTTITMSVGQCGNRFQNYAVGGNIAFDLVRDDLTVTYNDGVLDNRVFPRDEEVHSGLPYGSDTPRNEHYDGEQVFIENNCYEFAGWTDDDPEGKLLSNEEVLERSVTKDKEYTAHWQKVYYYKIVTRYYQRVDGKLVPATDADGKFLDEVGEVVKVTKEIDDTSSAKLDVLFEGSIGKGGESYAYLGGNDDCFIYGYMGNGSDNAFLFETAPTVKDAFSDNPVATYTKGSTGTDASRYQARRDGGDVEGELVPTEGEDIARGISLVGSMKIRPTTVTLSYVKENADEGKEEDGDKPDDEKKPDDGDKPDDGKTPDEDGKPDDGTDDGDAANGDGQDGETTNEGADEDNATEQATMTTRPGAVNEGRDTARTKDAKTSSNSAVPQLEDVVMPAAIILPLYFLALTLLVAWRKREYR